MFFSSSKTPIKWHTLRSRCIDWSDGTARERVPGQESESGERETVYLWWNRWVSTFSAGPGCSGGWSGAAWELVRLEEYWLGVCWVCMLWPVWRRVVTSGCDVKLWRQPVMSLAAAIIESAGLPRALHVSRKGCGTQRTWSIRPERINLGLRHVFVSWFLWRYLNQEYQAEYFDWIFRPSMTISLAMSFIKRVRGLKSMLSP